MKNITRCGFIEEMAPPKVGSLKQIKIAKDRLLIVEIITQPRGDEPAEAREIRG